MSAEVIGGEFDFLYPLGSRRHSDLFDGCKAYSSGRAAWYHILQSLTQRKQQRCVFLPDYLCDSIYRICDSLCLQYRFYPLTEKLRVDVPVLKADIDAVGGGIVLIINYFGLIDVEADIREVETVDGDVSVVLDNVQAPFAMSSRSAADVSFTSLRKAFPVPDGGLAYSKDHKLPDVSGASRFSQYKIAASFLKNLSRREDFYDDDIYLELYSRAESMIDDDLCHSASPYTMKAYPMLDIETYSLMRRQNAAYLIDGLSRIGLKPCVDIDLETVVPLFVPVVLDRRRDEIRKEMFRHRIFCPVHWPVTGHHCSLTRGKYMADCELSMIIDHRYSIDDMDRILNIVSDFI